MASLDEFAKSHRAQGRRAWWYSLPEEIRNEIVDSPAPSEVVVAWLVELGYDATFGKVDPFRRKARRDRQADAE